MKRIALAAAAAAVLAAPAAEAHVTLQPNEATAGSFTRLNVRVPNERDNAGTTKVDVQLPPGFAFVSYEAVPGWDVKVVREKADPPIDVHGEKINEQVTRVTFTGRGDGGIIGPGQFRDFGLSVRIPDGRAGAKLTFKATQTYENGEVVRWIGPEDSDEPAPVVTLKAAEEQHGAATTAATPAAAASSETGDDEDSSTLSLVALIIGALGLIVGATALLSGRRAQAPQSA